MTDKILEGLKKTGFFFVKLALIFLIIFPLMFVFETCSDLARKNPTTIEGSARDYYEVGERYNEIVGTVWDVNEHEFCLDGDNGIIFQCRPSEEGVLQNITPGNHMTVWGYVTSTSYSTVYLKKVEVSEYDN